MLLVAPQDAASVVGIFDVVASQRGLGNPGMVRDALEPLPGTAVLVLLISCWSGLLLLWSARVGGRAPAASPARTAASIQIGKRVV